MEREESEDINDDESDSEDDPFFCAILDNDIEQVKTLMKHGFSPTSISPYGDMAIHFAVLNSRKEIIMLFSDEMSKEDLNKIHIDKSDETICGTPLHVAVDEQVSVDTFKLLLDLGADVNANDAMGCPVLHHLIQIAFQDFEQGFVTCFSDNDETYFKDETLLDEGKSYLDKLRLLYDYGADMNVMNESNGMSPLHFWCMNFHWSTENALEFPESLNWCLEFVQLIIELGGNIEYTGERKTRPLWYFAQRYYLPQHIHFAEKYREMCRFLLSKCTELCAPDIHGRNILHVGAEFSNIVFLEESLKYVADIINSPDNFGLTPLHIITHNITKQEKDVVLRIISLLVEMGADLNARDKHGSTPIHHAIHMKNPTAVDALIGRGASFSIRDNKGLTAIDLAGFEGNAEVKELLGIIYDQSSSVLTVKGISDIRFGLFYPLCCSYGHISEDRSEDPDIVHINDIETWLEMHPMCSHNATVILQNSIPSLEPCRRLEEFATNEGIELEKIVLKCFQRVVDDMGRVNPLLECTISIGGSVSEGTKVGSRDELDIVFSLHKLANFVTVEEDVNSFGFAILKPRPDGVSFLQKCGITITKDGCLKREDVSRVFHDVFEQCLRNEDVWKNSCLYSEWGTVNCLGRGKNIGQVTLRWYGPILKRQTISIDIVPLIHVQNWEPRCQRKEINIISPEGLQGAGCYLVMKSTLDSKFNETAVDLNEVIEAGTAEEPDFADTYFKISYSHVEHAVISCLPREIKDGYKVAKSIQLQCPILSFDAFKSEIENLQLFRQAKIWMYVTSFLLKTALFHELDETGISLSSMEETTSQDTILEGQEARKCHVSKVLAWSSRIYKRLLVLCEEHECIPSYFTPCSPVNTSKSSAIIRKEFCKIVLYLLDHFPIHQCHFEYR